MFFFFFGFSSVGNSPADRPDVQTDVYEIGIIYEIEWGKIQDKIYACKTQRTGRGKSQDSSGGRAGGQGWQTIDPFLGVHSFLSSSLCAVPGRAGPGQILVQLFGVGRV